MAEQAPAPAANKPEGERAGRGFAGRGGKEGDRKGGKRPERKKD